MNITFAFWPCFLAVIAALIAYHYDFREIFLCHGQRYLVRITLLKLFGGKLMLNYFERSDEDRELHDHPWNFWSFILYRGYIEVTDAGRKRIRPGMILRRRTWWRHRVELINNKPSLSLVWRGRRKRAWGFYTTKGWLRHDVWWDQRNCDANQLPGKSGR